MGWLWRVWQGRAAAFGLQQCGGMEER
eukprot:COSAG01_NODE_12863_length_1673_cov_1.046379_3_plen_26_part_01